MPVVKYNTAIPNVMRLPLIDLAKPGNLPGVLQYIATLAPPCIAEGLISKLITDLIMLTGCTRKVALSIINGMIRVF